MLTKLTKSNPKHVKTLSCIISALIMVAILLEVFIYAPK